MILAGQLQRPCDRCSSSGFTLIEVLLAFVVFALSFTVVLEILSGSMRKTVRSKEYTEVALIAQSVMDLVGLDVPLEAGSSANGESGDYRWHLEISPFDDAEGDGRSIELGQQLGIDMLRVDFVISWGSGARERSSQFSTVRAVLANRRAGGA
jgi:general secretion pathway protein I